MRPAAGAAPGPAPAGWSAEEYLSGLGLAKVAAAREASRVNAAVGKVRMSFDAGDGRLLELRGPEGAIPLANGPRPAGREAGEAGSFLDRMRNRVAVELRHGALTIETENTCGLEWLRWTVSGSGVIRLDFRVRADSATAYRGIEFDFPGERLRGCRCARSARDRPLEAHGGAAGAGTEAAAARCEGCPKAFRWYGLESEEGELVIVSGRRGQRIGIPGNGSPDGVTVLLPESSGKTPSAGAREGRLYLLVK